MTDKIVVIGQNAPRHKGRTGVKNHIVGCKSCGRTTSTFARNDGTVKCRICHSPRVIVYT